MSNGRTLLFVLIHFVIKTHQREQSSPNQPNVCRNFEDYFKMENNPNCWFDRDASSDVVSALYQRYYTKTLPLHFKPLFQPDIIKNHGYPMNTYTVVTPDGYILTIFRIVRENAKEVVVLEPPMTKTSANFITSANISLGFALYEAGYDVWLPNSRGTYYSRTHVELNENDVKYWDFSFHELGVYDFPAELKLVKNVTKRSDVILIGYSMAGTALLVYASLLPQHAREHVKAVIMVGPAVYYMAGLNLDMAFNIIKTFELSTVFDSFETGKELLNLACNTHPLKVFCVLNVVSFVGRTANNIDPSLVPFIFANSPTRVSEKLLQHYSQNIDKDRFQQFDYGRMKNLMLYKNLTPPIYPLNQITVPFYTIIGDEDRLSPLRSADRIYSQLSSEAGKYGKHVIKTYNHIDYFWATTSKARVIDHIISFIENIH